MTEEKIVKGSELLRMISYVEERIEILYGIKNGNSSISIRNNSSTTYLEDDEKFILDLLLDYCRNKLIALKKEFDLL